MVQCVKRMELECLRCDSKLLRGDAKVVLRPAGGGIFDKFSLSVQFLAISIVSFCMIRTCMFSTTTLEQKHSRALKTEKGVFMAPTSF